MSENEQSDRPSTTGPKFSVTVQLLNFSVTSTTPGEEAPTTVKVLDDLSDYLANMLTEAIDLAKRTAAERGAVGWCRVYVTSVGCFTEVTNAPVHATVTAHRQQTLTKA